MLLEVLDPEEKSVKLQTRNALISKHVKATTVRQCALFLGVCLVKV